MRFIAQDLTEIETAGFPWAVHGGIEAELIEREDDEEPISVEVYKIRLTIYQQNLANSATLWTGSPVDGPAVHARVVDEGLRDFRDLSARVFRAC